MLGQSLRDFWRPRQPDVGPAEVQPRPRESIEWTVDGTTAAPCPACGNADEKSYLLAVRSLLPPKEMLSFATCPACATRFVPGYATPDYGDMRVSDYATRFYIEQGAGLDSLARPPFTIASRGGVSRYLEIGCGYGFGVDIAAQAFGWEAAGIDPSPIARTGVRDLDIKIDSLHLGPGTEKQVGLFDAIAAMEVIEHISDPIGFLSTLKAHLSPGGAIYMSTPNAAVLDRPKDTMLVAVLSPGYHVTIFSRDGLERAFVQAGFDNVQVIETGATLLAGATVGGEPLNVTAELDRDRFATYLRTRMEAQKPASPLWTGFAYRLYKELVNRGAYAEAEPVFVAIAEALLRKRKIDLMRPRTIIGQAGETDAHLQTGHWPFCIAGLMFFRGIQLINTNWAPEPPLPYFLAALDVGHKIRESLLKWGADDGDLQSQLAAAEQPLAMCLERLRDK